MLPSFSKTLQAGIQHAVMGMPRSNIAVKWGWLTAGFARLHPAPYLERWASPCLSVAS